MGVVICIIVIITVITGAFWSKNKNKYGEIIISNGSDTLDWSFYIIQDTDIVKMEKEKNIEKPKPDVEGGSITNKYYFKGLKKGCTKIFVANLLNEYLYIEEEYEVTVDENLNLSMNEIDVLYQCLKFIPMEEECEYHIENNNILNCLGYYEFHIGRDIKGYIIEGSNEGSSCISFDTSDGVKEYKINVDKDLKISY